jgi:biofilm PGA synthesis N-glycosyltransferase PgaC
LAEIRILDINNGSNHSADEPFSCESGGRVGVEPLTYALITPVRDEARALPRLAKSIFDQSLPPQVWVIVDTGSTDETPAIAKDLAAQSDVVVFTSVDEAVLARGGPIVRAFSFGLDFVVPMTDVVVKLDADVTFPRQFFEDVVHQFEKIKDLGIASGSTHEWERGAWRQKYATDDFVAGQCRLYRWECLQEILPLEERIGWDGLDLVRARIAGWTTHQFHDIPFRHHRAVGARERSQARSWYAMGDAMHYMGYRPYYAIAASIFNARTDVSALACIVGFTMAAVHRKPRHPDSRVLAYVSSRQRVRDFPKRAREKLGRGIERQFAQ